jgi:hypothetical protein
MQGRCRNRQGPDGQMVAILGRGTSHLSKAVLPTGDGWLTHSCADDQAHVIGERTLGLYRCWNRRIIRARG